ncbi:MAG: alpha/beta hydrolase [Acidimicrobiales bacterium]|jgi:acetyl esterase/lipase|nr:alpha/beta hydrolase [Acidimicrobiales bacterium]
MVDPALQRLLDAVPALPRDLPVEEERRRLGEVFGPLAQAIRPAPDVPVTRHELPGPLEVRVHGAGDGSGVLLQLQGGGFRLGGIDGAGPDAAIRADVLGIPVVTVGYRLAPEHPFPAALDDVTAALAFAAGLGGRLLVAGVSAGAHLALAAALRARDAGEPSIDALVLEVPILDPTLGSASVAERPDDPLLPRPTLERIWRDYLGAATPPDHPSVALLAADLRGLPPTLVVTAEHDPLRDEGEALVLALQAASVAAELHQVPGTVHGLHTTHLTAAGETAHERILAFLAQARGPRTQTSSSGS